MKANKIQVAIRNQAIYVDKTQQTQSYNPQVFELVENIRKLGFGLSEELLTVLKTVESSYYQVIYQTLQNILGTKHNWTPLIKDWIEPTNRVKRNAYLTFIMSWFATKKDGVVLACGHSIPKHTFPLERYNGCPLCGTPFKFEQLALQGAGSKIKVLNLWQEEEIEAYFTSLLQAKTALDVTQIDSLQLLLDTCELPTVTIAMRETKMIVIDHLITREEVDHAGRFFQSPTDILRYLWYKKTGFLQLVKPKTIITREGSNHKNLRYSLGTQRETEHKVKNELKLKYSRKDSIKVAIWLNTMALDVEEMCENMHPRREMWVRFIRALRLAEYSKRKGFEKLAELIDTFYNQRYTVIAGRIEYYRLKEMDAEQTFVLLKQRPGLFARSLFSNMLFFGGEVTLNHFEEVVHQVPLRLLLTLQMYAEIYFDPTANRVVKPLGGVSKIIPVNQLVKVFDQVYLASMIEQVTRFTMAELTRRYAAEKTTAKTMFIDPVLFHIPLSIGDRSDTVQDLPVAIMGTKFPLEEKQIRLFMQWGAGLEAQHLDMDLSCHIAYENTVRLCSYFNLTTTGCKHSGDIQFIPNRIGTAEYINIDVETLQKAGAKYVTFTCNAYSNGAITPNLVVGWMDSKNPMKVTKRTGVAYDPSAVIHQVRIVNKLNKGLVFGVLDVQKEEIIWLELAFGGQNIKTLDADTVMTLLNKLKVKMKIGDLLQIKAQAQEMEIVDSKDKADEVYDEGWRWNGN
ncbi:hypothetical protein [Myroides sp. TSA_177.3]|uniref:hypothetical protein n=1 Tax=Myroides sp. TSA_177.3 TaxID=3415650 RepID=UPI0040466D80